MLPNLAKQLFIFFQDSLIHLDNEAFRRLESHENKVILIQITGLKPLYFRVKSQGFELLDVSENNVADTIIAGSLSDFMNAFFSKKHKSGAIHIKGDLNFAKSFYDTWHHLDLDWEGFLASHIGDNAAVILSQGFKECRSWFQESYQHREQDITAFLQDETAMLPTPIEVEHFFTDIDQLRLDVERCEAKIQRLRQTLDG
jgi:ubiquinone biosynthesis protein UbiJ